ncbi:histone-lysine N-methyltransferase CLF isoform X2 [Aristolochia californica]|uniref:histone-lysine N-methyltransferase CLF isoform X2 n=1 Tax=Aristolochia californica TaxID=171875 RepID=UPI0035D92ACB
MTIKAAPVAPTSRSDSSNEEAEDASQGSVELVIDSLKKQVAVERCILIKKKMEVNKEKLLGVTNNMYTLTKLRADSVGRITDKKVDLLAKRQEDAINMLKGLNVTNGKKDNNSCHDDNLQSSSAVLLGNNFGGKNVVRPIKLPEVQRLPPYTTWIFLDRNQRMTEDQSVVGRRRIYYDSGEALICSDSEEEIIEEEEEKKEFGETEDYILWMTLQKLGLSEEALDSLAKSFDRKPCDVKARYESLLKREKSEPEGNADAPTEDAFADKDLDAALDSFDNLFCRRCLVFDCRLHGCSQDLVFPAEKQLPWNSGDEEKGMPCGVQCYRMVLKSENTAVISFPAADCSEHKLFLASGSGGDRIPPRKKNAGPSLGRKPKFHQSESSVSNVKAVSESSGSEIRPHHSLSPSKAGKFGLHKKNNKRDAERVLVCMRKRQKKMVASDSDSIVSRSHAWRRDMKLRSNSHKACKDAIMSSQKKLPKSPVARKTRRKDFAVHHDKSSSSVGVENELVDVVTEDPSPPSCKGITRKDEYVDENLCKHKLLSCDTQWKTIEKGLLGKGIEIFGRNSCLIARNLLNGMKTCLEVSQYMRYSESTLSCQTGDGANSHIDGSSQVECTHTMGTELRTRSRFVRRRGRVRRLKYTWKSAGYHSIRKRITERKDQPCRQYTPCGCQSACGKQCTCLLNGTCCEKYCGCPKSCKNRFRGCHCAKSQCRSRQCPCFAADRECDPDVCRNCWVGCGDGSLGGPSQRGDNYECRNMKLLLKQQQRVLLGKSDVSGWGAFLKNSVNKHEYLGEYTGELISHREADKRGKIYDRENSSFLFNLNDQFVLDAYRKGDKLKFANHSPDPNCYAKVIMVAGDHRVGIFAKEKINSGEELFYDYRYEPDRAPAWAKKPEAPGVKKDDLPTSTGRAKKLA